MCDSASYTRLTAIAATSSMVTITRPLLGAAMCQHFKTKSKTLTHGLRELLDRDVIDKGLFQWGEELRIHGSGLLHRNARAQPSIAIDSAMIVPAGRPAYPVPQSAQRGVYSDVGVEDHVKGTIGNHADDGEDLAVQLQLNVQHSGIAGELARPASRFSFRFCIRLVLGSRQFNPACS